jgi:hypothetical protein
MIRQDKLGRTTIQLLIRNQRDIEYIVLLCTSRCSEGISSLKGMRGKGRSHVLQDR